MNTNNKTGKNILNNRYINPLMTLNILKTTVLIIGCLLSYFINTDYSFVGVLMIWAFYNFEKNKEMLFIALILINLVYGFPQVLAAFSLFIINLYNGKKGKKVNKFVFYGFYPIHLMVLYVISLFIG